MSRYLNDSAEVAITCPSCRQKFNKSLRELQDHAQFTCPQCGHAFDASDFKAGIKDADKAVDELARKLRRFGK